jgi:hypothetical protein
MKRLAIRSFQQITCKYSEQVTQDDTSGHVAVKGEIRNRSANLKETSWET